MQRNRLNYFSFCLVISSFLFSSHAFAEGGKGMSWTKISHDAKLGIDQVNCNNGAPDGCNAYHGDTSCLVSQPILCLKVDNSNRPAYIATVSDFYDGWAGGHIATTPPIQGILLASPAVGDLYCQISFGEGWRMAEHHDNRIGGWGFRAYGNIRNDQRFWVKINGQPANCWNP